MRYDLERTFSLKIPLPRKGTYPMFQCGEDTMRRKKDQDFRLKQKKSPNNL